MAAQNPTTAPSVPVLEMGGSHVTAALVGVGPEGLHVLRERRFDLDPHAPADVVLGTLATAGDWLGAAPGAAWGLAVPGPFDYAHGVARYEGVGKFDALNGLDVGAGLRARLGAAPGRLVFLNDADAFGLGECAAGAARGHDRAVCITLGTGVGSAFVDHGAPVGTGPHVPPDGEAHLVLWQGRPLEQTVSRRALRAAYTAATGLHLDVHEIAHRMRAGESAATTVLGGAMHALGQALARYVDDFGATVLVLGGSIAGSFDLIEPHLRAGLVEGRPGLAGLVLSPAHDLEHAPLVGAASAVLAHDAAAAR